MLFRTFFVKSFGSLKISPTFALAIQQWWIHLRARIPASHAGHRGSNPLSTTETKTAKSGLLFFTCVGSSGITCKSQCGDKTVIRQK